MAQRKEFVDHRPVRSSDTINVVPEWKPYCPSVDLDDNAVLPARPLFQPLSTKWGVERPEPIELPPGLQELRVSLDPDWISYLTSLHMENFQVSILDGQSAKRDVHAGTEESGDCHVSAIGLPSGGRLMHIR